MPNQPKTPLQNIRVDRELWSSAMAKARAEGCTLSEVIREFLRSYVR